MRLKQNKNMATTMFAQKTIGYVTVTEKKSVTIGSSISTAIPITFSESLSYPRVLPLQSHRRIFEVHPPEDKLTLELPIMLKGLFIHSL